MVMKNTFLLTLFAFLISFSTYAQLTNIESQRIRSGGKRFVLDGNFTFYYNNNNGNFFYNIGSGLSAQFKNKALNKIYFIIGNYYVSKSKSENLRDSWFLHFRYNYKLTKWFPSEVVRFEAFIQTQNNKLLTVNSRNLIGAGLRLKLTLTKKENKSDDKFNLQKIFKPSVIVYVGNSYMYEEEKSDAFNEKDYNHRNSSYISIQANINKNLSISNNAYYQPLYSDFGDYKILEQFVLSTKISTKLRLYCQFDYYYDSIVPGGGNQFSSSLSMGLSVSLK